MNNTALQRISAFPPLFALIFDKSVEPSSFTQGLDFLLCYFFRSSLRNSAIEGGTVLGPLK